MTIESINIAKNLIDTLFYKSNEALSANIANTSLVKSLLSDNRSKIAYDTELAYLSIFYTFKQGSIANNLTQGMSLEQFLSDCNKAGLDHSLPKLKSSKQGHDHNIEHTLCCTYYYEQYRYERDDGTFVGPNENDVVLDCGACYGDTALWFDKYKVKDIYAFEVLDDNLKVLEDNLKQLQHSKVYICPVGLSNKSGQLYFNANKDNDGAGKVEHTQSDHSSVINVIAIDEFCANNNVVPNFIKMDIEGSEYDALQGAATTIKKYKPRLAICLYHYLEDMWRIPLLLHSYNSNYKFYVKKSHPYVEFVLFAIDES